MYDFLTSTAEWPKEPGIYGMKFEISTLYPVWLCYVAPGEKFSKAIIEAGEQYLLALGQEAQFAFLRSIPSGAEEFMEVKGITLVRADWVQERFVLVCRGGCQTMQDAYRHWRKVAEVQNV